MVLMDTLPSDGNSKKGTTPHKTPLKRQKLENLPLHELVKHYNSLLEKEEDLTKELGIYTEKCVSSDLNAEMQALHKYNDMKDFTQIVLGYLSDVNQTTVTELHAKYNLPTD